MSRKSIPWDKDAREQLARAPFFVRKLAQSRVEKAAREQDLDRVTLELVAQVKNKAMSR